MQWKFLAALSLVSSAVLGSPRMANSAEPLGPRASLQATAMNAPLTDWIKNNSTDLQWYTTISVGIPPQAFTVVVDTGSNILLLPQNNCSNCFPEQRTFSPSNSSTFSWSSEASGNDSNPWFSTGVDTIPFAEAQPARCNWAVDDVSIQGLTASQFPFLLCYDEPAALSTMPGIDGVLGLSLNGTGSFQWALYDAGLLDSGIFGLYMPPGQVTGGQITLGGVDKTKFEGDLTWVALNKELAADHGQWVANMQTIFINGKQLQVPSRSSPSTSKVPYPKSLVQVLDTGTSFIMAPDNATAAALYSQVSSKIYQIDAVGTWGCSCEEMDDIVEAGVELTFLLGYDGEEQQLNLTLPSSFFNLGPYPGRPELCQAVVNDWSDGVFYDGTVGLWELGSPLLKNYYTAWDGLDLQVGFAPLESSTLSNSSASPIDDQKVLPVNIGFGGALMMVNQ